MNLAKRLPNLGQILPVYAVTVMMFYGWTIWRYFWQTPSWLHYLSIYELLGILSYAVLVDFFESLTILLALLFLSFLLPEKWFRDVFVARGSMLVLLNLGYLMYFDYSFKTASESDFPSFLVKLLPLVLVVILLLTFLAGKINILKNFVEEFSSRAVIFLYISIPISVIGTIYVIVRNLFWGHFQ